MNKLKLNYRLNAGTVQLIINYGHKLAVDGKTTYKPLKISTGVTDRHNSFDLKAGRFLKSDPDYKNLNLSLQKTETKVQELFNKLTFESGDVSNIPPETIKAFLTGDTLAEKKEATTKYINLFTIFQEYIDAIEKMGKLERLTIYNYKQVLATLKEFKGDKPLLESDLTLNFHANYFDFLKEKGLGNNSLWRFQKTFRTMLKHLKSRGITVGYDYLSAQIRVSYKTPDNIALSIEELKTLYGYESKKNYLNRVKHLFLFQCCTGVRYSDINKFVEMKECNTPTGEKYQCFDITTEKTGAKVNIPVVKLANEIYEMYKGELPEISNQKYNKYLHELLMEIDYFKLERKKIVFENKKKTEIKYTIAEQVTSHTARRTFATIMFELGCPVRTIMSITSHTRLETFFSYIKESTDDNQKMIELLSKFDAQWS